MNTKTRAISEGAMMLAIMGVVLLLNRQSAGFFELMLFFLSIPVIVYEVKYGEKMALTLCVSAVVLSLLLSTPTSIFYMGIAMVIGFIYGYGVLHDYSNQKLLFFTVIANLISIYLTAIVFASLFGYDLKEEVNELLKILPKLDVGALTLRTFVEEIILISYIGISFVQALVTHLMANRLLQRFKLNAKPLISIFEFRFPKGMALLIIASMFLYVGSGYIILHEGIHQIVLALYATCLLIAIVDGEITILCYLRMKQKQENKALIFLALFACFIPVIQNVIGLVGVFDIYEGFRAKMKVGVSHEVHRKN